MRDKLLHQHISIKIVRIIFFAWIALVAVIAFSYLMVRDQRVNKAAEPRAAIGGTGGSGMCLQVITRAYNATTGECRLFSSSCLDAGFVKSNTCEPGTTTPVNPTSAVGSGGVGAACASDAGCASPNSCVNGVCKAPVPTAVPTQAAACRNQGEACGTRAGFICCDGLSCQLTPIAGVADTPGTCVTAVTPTKAPVGAACEVTGNCETGLECRSSKCSVPPVEAGAVGQACKTGHICNNGVICNIPLNICQVGASTGTGVQNQACAIDAQCRTGLFCDYSKNTCQPVAAATTNPGTTQTISINLKLKLQGVTRKPHDGETSLPVTVIVQQGSSRYRQTGRINADAQGLWTNASPLTFSTITPASNFAVFIKAGQHLQKKVCNLNPEEPKDDSGDPLDLKYTCGNTPQITLNGGLNTLDLTGISLPACDLPIDGQQDGVCDSLDMAYLMTNDQSRDDAVLAIGDLNHDGVINVIDRNIVRYVLSTQRDEER